MFEVNIELHNRTFSLPSQEGKKEDDSFFIKDDSFEKPVKKYWKYLSFMKDNITVKFVLVFAGLLFSLLNTS